MSFEALKRYDILKLNSRVNERRLVTTLSLLQAYITSSPLEYPTTDNTVQYLCSARIEDTRERSIMFNNLQKFQ